MKKFFEAFGIIIYVMIWLPFIVAFLLLDHYLFQMYGTLTGVGLFVAGGSTLMILMRFIWNRITGRAFQGADVGADAGEQG